MQKHLLAVLSALSVLLVTGLFLLQKLEPGTQKVTHSWYFPDPHEPDLEYFDERSFEIAAILERKGLATDSLELLELGQLILDKSEEIQVSPALLLAVIHVESTFDPCARSRVGAQGLMQVMPQRILGKQQYYDEFAFNYHRIYDPKWNIAFGADYLGRLIKRFGSVETALVAYNAGPTRVDSWLRDERPLHTVYPRKVFANVKRFPAAIQGGEPALF